jgi:hypothetical protein
MGRPHCLANPPSPLMAQRFCSLTSPHSHSTSLAPHVFTAGHCPDLLSEQQRVARCPCATADELCHRPVQSLLQAVMVLRVVRQHEDTVLPGLQHPGSEKQVKVIAHRAVYLAPASDLNPSPLLTPNPNPFPRKKLGCPLPSLTVPCLCSTEWEVSFSPPPPPIQCACRSQEGLMTHCK